MTLRIAIPVLALAAGLAACDAPTNAIGNYASPPARTLTVSGTGEAAAAPDMAVLSIGVETEGATAGEALRENSAKMRAAIETLTSLGVEERDIQTSGLNVNPRYNYQGREESPRLIGFIAVNVVTATLRDLDEAGAIIDETVGAGANKIRSLRFSFSDPQPLYDEARRDAVARARAKATLLSEAAGVRLGSVLTIQDGHVSAPKPYMPMARLETAMAESVPLQSGESTVTAGVSIVYEID